MAYVKIRPRRSTQAQWEYANPILAEGEIAFQVPDTGVGTGLVNFKIGDGVSAWNNLPWAFNAADLADDVAALSEIVVTYDSRITTVEEAVTEMEKHVGDIRKIEIQSSEPSDDLTLGEIWIATDIVTGSLVISATSLSLEVGNSSRLTLANTLSSWDRIVWTTSDESVAALSSTSSTTATVTAVTRGSAVITASAYLGNAVIYSVSCSVTASMSGGIIITPDTARIIMGNSQVLNLTNSLTSFDRIEWVSSAATYVNVTTSSNTQATIMAYRSGGATIYARAYLNGTVIASANCVCTVVGMQFTTSSATMDVGGSVRVNINNTMVYGTDYDTITWNSSAENICTISASNVASATLVGAGAGECTITATASLSGTTVQTISLPVTVSGTLTLSETYMQLSAGSTAGLTVTNSHAPSEYDNITWSTTDDHIVSISSSSDTSAIIEAEASGNAVITVTAYLGGEAIDTASCTVNVEGSLVMDQPEATISSGTTKTLTATNTLDPSSFSRIRWTTNDANVCAISSYSGTSAEVTGVTAGTATVTVIAVDSEGATVASDICLVTVE
jgi:hypothetical protein